MLLCFRLKGHTMERNFILSRENPDSRLAGCDGQIAIHSSLLLVHSDILKEIFETLIDPSESIVILPNFKVDEVKTLVKLIYGIESIGIVCESVLDTLGLQKYKKYAVVGSNDVQINVPSEGDFMDMNENDITTVSENVEDISVNVVNFDQNVAVSQTQNETDLSNKVLRFPCEYCGKILKTSRTMINHAKLKHSNDEAYMRKSKEISAGKSLNRECNICGNLYNSRKIKEHIKEEHPDVNVEEKCETCHKSFPDRFHLKRHMDSAHSEVQGFDCNICGIKVKRLDHLQEHLLLHAADKSFKCDKCNYSTTRKRNMTAHKCRPKLFKCDLCGQMTVSKEGLRKHRRKVHS